jgi:hypothetical protein
VDALAEGAPLLSALSAASIQGLLATGPRAGHLLLSPLELIEKLAAAHRRTE